MNVYLAGFACFAKHWHDSTEDIFLLSSFWEHKNGNFEKFVYQKKHLLDSGAFTAINDKTGKYKNFNWDDYVKKYIAFIKHTNQKLFFELDIDCVVGLSKVEYYRKQIEDAIGLPPIVCWHSSRGSEYWIKSCEEYPYVALGCTNQSPTGKIIRQDPSVLNWFIGHAHKNNAKIHGLGFTNIEWLKKLKFDSVDSTTWISGQKFGCMQRWDGNKMQQFKRGKNCIMINPNERLKYNFIQWVKFQKFAFSNL